MNAYLSLSNPMSSQFYNCKVPATNCSLNLIEPNPEGGAGDGVRGVGRGHLHGAGQGRAHHHGSLCSKLARMFSDRDVMF